MMATTATFTTPESPAGLARTEECGLDWSVIAPVSPIRANPAPLCRIRECGGAGVFAVPRVVWCDQLRVSRNDAPIGGLLSSLPAWRGVRRQQ